MPIIDKNFNDKFSLNSRIMVQIISKHLNSNYNFLLVM